MYNLYVAWKYCILRSLPIKRETRQMHTWQLPRRSVSCNLKVNYTQTIESEAAWGAEFCPMSIAIIAIWNITFVLEWSFLMRDADTVLHIINWWIDHGKTLPLGQAKSASQADVRPKILAEIYNKQSILAVDYMLLNSSKAPRVVRTPHAATLARQISLNSRKDTRLTVPSIKNHSNYLSLYFSSKNVTELSSVLAQLSTLLQNVVWIWGRSVQSHLS